MAAGDKVPMNETLDPDGVPQPYSMMDIVVTLAELVMMLVILVGNTLVVVSVYRFPQLRTSTNRLIASLAMADIGVGLSLPFIAMFNIYPSFRHQWLACALRYQFIIIMMTVSQFTLVLVSVDRFVAVQFPLRYSLLMSARRVKSTLAVIWMYSILFPIIQYVPPIGRSDWTVTPNCEMEDMFTPGYQITLVLHFFLSMIVMLIFYSRVFCIARGHVHRMSLSDSLASELETATTSVVPVKSEKRMLSRATKTLFVVLGVFICCWMPFFLILTVHMICKIHGVLNTETRQHLIYTRMVFSMFAIANSMLNPFIYAGKSHEFRQAFRRLLFPGQLNRQDGLELLRTRPSATSLTSHRGLDRI